VRRLPLEQIFPEHRSGFWGKEPGTLDRDVRIVRNGDVGADGSIRWSDLPRRALTDAEYSKSALAAGDILLTTSGNCARVGWVGKLSEPTSASNFTRLLRADPKLVDSRYVFHLMNSAQFLLTCAPFVRGTTMENLSVRDAFAAIELPAPTLEEQRRISAILDVADVLRVRRRQALDQLNALRRSIFIDMFGRPLGQPSASTVALGDVAELFSGGTLPDGTEFNGQPGGFALVKVSDLARPGNDRDLRTTAAWRPSPGPASSTCPPGSVVIPKRGGAIATNRKRIATRHSILDPNLMGVLPMDGRIQTEYLFGWFDLLALLTAPWLLARWRSLRGERNRQDQGELTPQGSPDAVGR